MFSTLGDIVNRTWLLILIGWVILAVVLRLAAPDWNEVAQDGQFSFLPDDSPSRRADDLFNKAFPHDLLASSIVVVVSREGEQELSPADLDFVSGVLKPRLRKIAGLPEHSHGQESDRRSRSDPPVIVRMRAFDDPVAGKLLMSSDRKATLIVLEVANDFFSRLNQPTIREIEDALDELRQDGRIPADLEVHLTGSAVVGRDITQASERSAKAVERWTILLVAGLTLVVFRAPLLALIPLVTLYFAMHVALKILSLLAGAHLIDLFKGIESYSTVVVYASGVDYSLFLISRFQEELEGGSDIRHGIRQAVGKVGAAIAASTATEVAGIGMMVFARFGKFHQAGIAIGFSLVVMLVAVMTLTPALLRLAGRGAFWPHRQAATVPPNAPRRNERPRATRIQILWEQIAAGVLRRPGTLWLATTALLAPLAVIGIVWYNHLNYDLVANLPRSAASAQGMHMLERHFPAGTPAPVNVLIRSDHVDFRSPEGVEVIQALTDRLHDRRDELQIADIRSAAAPLGMTSAGKVPAGGGLGQRMLTAAAVRRQALNYFVSSDETLGQQVTRLELELNLDPFSEQAIDFLDSLKAALEQLLPPALETGAALDFSGSTASLRDLKVVGARDRTLINVLVVASVVVILMLLLRRAGLTLYLVLTVLFSYLVTLGATFAVFYLADPRGFPGLDWTVPLFLFTVLIAIGEDYNILLVTRIDEEEQVFGPEQGVAAALVRTGPIISSCGLIMAGTFLALAIAGQLAQMIQLGFALAFGVLLDTFVVRPILVPAWLIFIHRVKSRQAVRQSLRASAFPHRSLPS